MVYNNMKRLWMVCFLLVVSSFVFAYSSATPDPGHDAENIFVFVNGQNLGLQGSIDSGKFGAHYTGGSYSGSVVSGHDDDIFVRVSGVDKSLQTAINDGSLCASTVQSGSYSGSVVFGHKGDDVLIDFGGEKSLQQAINDGLFGRDCVVPVNCGGYWNYDYGSCSATTCGTTGRYDKLWITTVSPSGNGAACPSPTFVDNAGNACSAAACAKRCDNFESNRVCDLGGNVLWSQWGLSEAQCLAKCEADNSVVCCHRESSGFCAGRGSGTSIVYYAGTQAANCELPSGNSCTAVYTGRYSGWTYWPPRDYGWCVVGTQEYVIHYLDASAGELVIKCKEDGRKNSADVCCGIDTGFCNGQVLYEP